jgi:hypothetical protein
VPEPDVPETDELGSPLPDWPDPDESDPEPDVPDPDELEPDEPEPEPDVAELESPDPDVPRSADPGPLLSPARRSAAPCRRSGPAEPLRR